MTIDHRIVWNEAKDYLGITMGLIIYAAAFTVFLMPYEIVTGGVTGMSAIICLISSAPVFPGFTTFTVNSFEKPYSL